MSLTPAQTQFLQSAVAPAQASQASFGVPASVTIAQAILESGWGAQHIGTANNYFGIKAAKRADGTVDFGSIATGYVQVPTREVVNGQSVMVNALFRSYDTMTNSFRDHGQFLHDNSRYNSAFQTTDADEFARRIAAAGYATDPTYATVVISLMKNNNLYQYNTAAGTAPSGSGSPDGGTSGSGTDGGTTDGGTGTGTDSGTTGTDSGTTDGGASSSTGDSGDTTDSGTGSTDSGTGSTDSGTGSTDSGTGSTDSGSTTDGGNTDSGTSGSTTDSGTGGSNSTDSGTTDSGSGTTDGGTGTGADSSTSNDSSTATDSSTENASSGAAGGPSPS